MWLNAIDRFFIKLRPEKCGLYIDEYLKSIGFLGESTPLIDDNIVQVTDSDNTDDKSYDFDYNIATFF